MSNTSKMTRVDLNSDMGEGFGDYKMGDDAGILAIVSSANVACGFHAGDPDIMVKTFELAKERGVAIGAHPGYNDRAGFGRRIIPHSLAQIERLVAYQIGAAQALVTYAGHKLTYVKTHGALGNQGQADVDVAKAVARAVRVVDPGLAILGIARSALLNVSLDMGLKAYHEIYADRAYTEEGFLVPRSEKGAVLHDPDQCAQRVLRMVSKGAIETRSGAYLDTPIDSICLHSDTPGAVGMAVQVRKTLEAAGIQIKSFSS